MPAIRNQVSSLQQNGLRFGIANIRGNRNSLMVWCTVLVISSILVRRVEPSPVIRHRSAPGGVGFPGKSQEIRDGQVITEPFALTAGVKQVFLALDPTGPDW